MTQYHGYDLYRNNIGICSPIFYTKTSLNIIREHWQELENKDRPEASAWRLKEINGQTQTSDLVVGIHGFFQDKATMSRAFKNKLERKQLGEYDFDFVNKLVNYKLT